MLMARQDTVPPGYEPVDLGSGFSSLFGPTFVHRSLAKLGFRVADRHTNPRGVCHGGALATFADAQIVAVEPDAAKADTNTPTITLTVDYLAPIPLGAWVEADVTLLKRTRTMIFTQALISVDGDTVARSSAIYPTSNQTGGRP